LKKPLRILSPPKHHKEVELIATGKVVLLVIAAPAGSKSVKQCPDISRHDDMVLD
jgi:hypothetical protein